MAMEITSKYFSLIFALCHKNDATLFLKINNSNLLHTGNHTDGGSNFYRNVTLMK